MEFGIRDKVALVAAGSEGIGFAAVEELLTEGCRVSFCSRSDEKVRAATDRLVEKFGRGRVHAVAADISKEADIVSWISAARGVFGKPSILVTNTGGPPASSALATTDEQWKSGLDSTLLNVVRMTREVAEDMKSAGWGRIVHVTSLVARDPSPLLTISSTLRTGLRALTKLQARELGPFGVTVNSVLPGHTRTARQIHLAEIEAAKQGLSVEQILAKKADKIPARRLAEASEIGAAIAFLCSARASYVSGESLLVDAGDSGGI